MIVYTCQDHVLESLKMASSASEGPPKKVPKWRVRQEWKKEFPWLHFDEEKEKMFCTVCKKAKRKNPFASGGCINFQHSTLTKHAMINNHKVALQDAQLRGQFTRVRVRVRVSRHYNSVIVWETCFGMWIKTGFCIVILDSKYSKMTPKFVKQKSHWHHSSIKFANPGPNFHSWEPPYKGHCEGCPSN